MDVEVFSARYDANNKQYGANIFVRVNYSRGDPKFERMQDCNVANTLYRVIARDLGVRTDWEEKKNLTLIARFKVKVCKTRRGRTTYKVRPIERFAYGETIAMGDFYTSEYCRLKKCREDIITEFENQKKKDLEDEQRTDK